MKRLLPITAAITLLLSAAPAAYSDTGKTFAEEEKFVLKMADKENYRDFVDQQLTKMKKEFPELKDKLTILEARVLIARKKKEKALKLIETISKDSPFYRDARLVQAEIYGPQEPKKAIAAYLDYIKSFKGPQKEPLQSEILRAVQKCAYLMGQNGQTKEAKELWNFYFRNGRPADPQEVRYNLAMNYIVAAQQRHETGREVNKKELQEALAILEQCLWERDIYHALAVIERIHIFCMMEQWEHAKKEAELYRKFIDAFDQLFQPEERHHSPKVGFLFYQGVILTSEGTELYKQAPGSTEALALIQAGSEKWQLIKTRFSNSSYHSKLPSAYAEVTGKLQQQGLSREQIEVIIPVAPKMADAALFNKSYREGVNAFRMKSYKGAAEAFEKAIKADQNHEQAPDAYKFLILATFNSNKMANDLDYLKKIDQFASEALRVHSEHKSISDITKLMAGIYNLKAKALKGKMDEESRETHSSLKDKGNQWALQYIRRNPNDPVSEKWAFGIAEQKRAALRDRILVINQISDGVRREKETAVIKEEIRALIPEYEWIINKTGSTKLTVVSRNILGALHNMIGEYQKAADYWLAYAELETDPKVDKVQIRLNAGKVLIDSSTPGKAVEILEKILKELKAETENATNPQLQNQIVELLDKARNKVVEKWQNDE